MDQNFLLHYIENYFISFLWNFRDDTMAILTFGIRTDFGRVEMDIKWRDGQVFPFTLSFLYHLFPSITPHELTCF
jgi:hypothetical protein